MQGGRGLLEGLSVLLLKTEKNDKQEDNRKSLMAPYVAVAMVTAGTVSLATRLSKRVFFFTHGLVFPSRFFYFFLNQKSTALVQAQRVECSI